LKLTAKNLENLHVRLEVLGDAHRIPLKRAAEADSEIWATLYPYSMVGEHFEKFWTRIQEERVRRRSIPFAVVREGRCVGITCFLELNESDRSVNIGGSYYHPDFRGGVVNPAAKLLLLQHAFGSGCTRVQFRVDEINARSRRAVAKIGGVQEGILRRDKVTWTGRVRSTVIFSILDNEWPLVSDKLHRLIDEFAVPETRI
jgi:RimJ/RimL family protein N-acetyltransferase